MKKRIIIALVLIKINYAFNINEIIATFNINMQKWNAILMQLNKNKERYLIKYKSDI